MYVALAWKSIQIMSYIFSDFSKTYVVSTHYGESPLMSTHPVSILRKSISGRHRPVRVADGPMTVRCRFT